MTYDEMNEFIRNYIENDNTGRAIMLSGSWGSGKSYYIKEKLKKYLESENGGVHKCAIVSLYGLTSTSDISKAIYMELRSIKKEVKSEAGNTAKVVGKIVAKTVANGLASKIGFDIGNVTDEDLQKVYDSLDLTGKLIVLEDIERTKINLIELLGFVNNLCENDGVKILLVTNEAEILTKVEIKKENEKSQWIFTKRAAAYIKAKEKSVGDTIIFSCDYHATIKGILKQFNDSLSQFNTDQNYSEIKCIFSKVKSSNLRAFIYACQKSSELLQRIDKEKITVSDRIKNIIFYGIIAFTQRQSQKGALQFEANTYLSGRLGVDNETPLFRFCYDYIVLQEFSKELIENATTYYTDYLSNSQWNTGKDQDLKVIREYSIRKDDDIISSFARIPSKINDGTISCYDYCMLIGCTIAIRFEAGIDLEIDSIVGPIIDRLKKYDSKDNIGSLFESSYSYREKKAEKEFDAVKSHIMASINKVGETFFPYDPEKIEEYCADKKEILKSELKTKGFACSLDIDRFIEALKNCTPAQINSVRQLFNLLYQDQHYSQIVAEDLEALLQIFDRVVKILSHHDGYGKTTVMQYRWFRDDLTYIINMLQTQKESSHPVIAN